MSEWKESKLGDIATTYAGGTPNRSNPFFFGGDVPWISSSEVNQAHIDKTKEFITELGLRSSSAKWVPKNSILIALYGATAGQISKLLINATTNQAVLAIIPDGTLADVNYLYYYLQNCKEKIIYLAQGSGQPNLSKALVDKTVVNAPISIQEQRKIARILSTVDAVIEQTEQTVAKYKAIKAGMLQDLFTRGLDANGVLRHHQAVAPHLYKQSELGWIPVDWDIETLGDIGEFKNGVNKDKESFGRGTLFVNIIDAYPEILNCDSLGRVAISEGEKSDYGLVEGDIIFVRSSVKPEGVGYNTLFVGCAEDVVFCGFMIRFRLRDKKKFQPDFYNRYFRFEEFRKRLIASSTVSANTNINQVSLGKLLVVKPKEEEQTEIVKRLKSLDTKLETEQTYLHKLQKLKAGLMNDLLSGNKPVIVEEETAASV